MRFELRENICGVTFGGASRRHSDTPTSTCRSFVRMYMDVTKNYVGRNAAARFTNGRSWRKAIIHRAAYAVARGATALQLKGDLSGMVGLIVVHKSGNRHTQQPYGFLEREHRPQQIERHRFQLAAALY